MYKTYVMFSNIFISPLKNVEKMWFAFVFASVSVHGKHFDIQTFVVEIILAGYNRWQNVDTLSSNGVLEGKSSLLSSPLPTIQCCGVCYCIAYL